MVRSKYLSTSCQRGKNKRKKKSDPHGAGEQEIKISVHWPQCKTTHGHKEAGRRQCACEKASILCLPAHTQRQSHKPHSTSEEKSSEKTQSFQEGWRWESRGWATKRKVTHLTERVTGPSTNIFSWALTMYQTLCPRQLLKWLTDFLPPVWSLPFSVARTWCLASKEQNTAKVMGCHLFQKNLPERVLPRLYSNCQWLHPHSLLQLSFLCPCCYLPSRR